MNIYDHKIAPGNRFKRFDETTETGPKIEHLFFPFVEETAVSPLFSLFWRYFSRQRREWFLVEIFRDTKNLSASHQKCLTKSAKISPLVTKNLSACV